MNRTIHSHALRTVFAVALLCGLAGCNSTAPGMTAISGSVTLNGKPAGPGTVSFMPTDGSGNTATGNFDKTGRFVMSAHAPGDGVKPGTYKVSVTIVDVPAHGDDKGNLIPPTYQSPEKYMNPETSGFTIVVESGKSQTVTFDLKT